MIAILNRLADCLDLMPNSDSRLQMGLEIEIKLLICSYFL